MRILITNDDGIDSPGLTVLAIAVKDWLDSRKPAGQSAQKPAGQSADPSDSAFELVVAAPAVEHSGASASMGVLAQHTPIDYWPQDIPGLADVTAFKVAATPAACAILGCLGAFGEPFDLLISGINYGANCGRSVLPSGTIGAALTAANYGISGLAVSQDAPHKNASLRWEVAAEMACEQLDWLLQQPRPTTASLNVPNLERSQIKGIQFAPPLAPLGVVVTKFTSRDEHKIYSTVTRAPGQVPAGTDRDLLLKGWATLAPLLRPTVDFLTPPPAGAVVARSGADIAGNGAAMAADNTTIAADNTTIVADNTAIAGDNTTIVADNTTITSNNTAITEPAQVLRDGPKQQP